MAQYNTEHGHQIFIHAEAKGGEGREVPSVAYINRETAILRQDAAYKVAIERFYVHGVKLPLFQCTDKFWQIGMRAIDVPTTLETVDWAGDEYIYDLRLLAIRLSETLDSLASTLEVDDVPVMKFDTNTNKFILQTTSTFRAGYEILFSNRMAWALNSFFFASPDADKMERLIITDDDEIQGTPTLELLSPVSRAALRTTSLPVVPELLPPLATADPGEITKRETGFLVDYNISQSSSQSTQGILFTPPGFLRWHNLMTTSDLSSFSISAWWIDYSGNFHQIYLPVVDSTLEIYMVFRDA